MYEIKPLSPNAVLSVIYQHKTTGETCPSRFKCSPSSNRNHTRRARERLVYSSAKKNLFAISFLFKKFSRVLKREVRILLLLINTVANIHDGIGLSRDIYRGFHIKLEKEVKSLHIDHSTI